MKVYLGLYVSSKKATEVFGICSSCLLLKTFQISWIRIVTTLILFTNLKFGHNQVRQLVFALLGFAQMLAARMI